MILHLPQTVDDDIAGDTNLTLVAGLGNIDFDGIVGGTALGDVIINSATDVTADAAFSANTLTQVAGTGDTQFDALVTLQAIGGMDITTNTVTLNAGINTLAAGNDGTVTITNAGLLDIAPGADMALDGAFLQDGNGSVETAGDISTTADDITFTTDVTLTDAHAVAMTTGAGAGTITFSSTLDGETDFLENLTLTADTGNIDFDAAVGATKDLGIVTIVSATDVTADLAFNAQAINQTAGSGTTTFTGAVQTLGTLATDGLDLNGTKFTISNTVNTGTLGEVRVTNSGLLSIAAAGDMTLGGLFLQDGGGTVSTAGDITTTNDNITFTDAVTLTGNVALTSGTGS